MRSKKEREKNKSEGGGEVREGTLTSLPSPPLLFIAIFTSHRSPLSERLEQATFSGTVELKVVLSTRSGTDRTDRNTVYTDNLMAKGFR